MPENIVSRENSPNLDACPASQNSWVEELKVKAEVDKRKQPWKDVFGEEMNTNIENVNDLTSIIPNPSKSGRPALYRSPSNGLTA
jgi:hypothetical protein